MQSLLDQVIPFVLVMFRLAGMAMGAPVLSGRMIPARVRVLVVVTLAVALFPSVPRAALEPVPTSLFALGGLIARETLIGLSMGMIAGLPLAGATLGGFIVGHQMGLGLAQTYNPEADADTDIVAQLMSFSATGIFLAVGGLEALFTTLAGTFERLPVGGLRLEETPVDLLVNVIASGCELGMRIAAPVMCIIFLMLIALGVVGKTIPQLNVMTVGFALKIIVGLLVLAASLTAIETAIADEFIDTLRGIAHRAQGLGGERSAPDGV